MPHSPEDIVAYEFRARTRGYDRDEVDGFLDALADQIEQERAQTSALEECVAALETDIAEAKDSERALKRTLITVQDAADRALSEAHEEVAQLRERAAQEAEATRVAAQAQAREIVEAAERAALEQRERIGALQQLDAEHRGRLREHLESQLEAVRDLPDPFAALAADLPTPESGSQERDGEALAPVEDEEPGKAPVDEPDPWRLQEPSEPAAAADEHDPPMWG